MGNEFEVPQGCYIDIAGFGPERYRLGSSGEVFITVYQEINKSTGDHPVHNVRSVGSFKIEAAVNMNMRDFLREIREGVEKIVKSETPETPKRSP